MIFSQFVFPSFAVCRFSRGTSIKSSTREGGRGDNWVRVRVRVWRSSGPTQRPCPCSGREGILDTERECFRRPIFKSMRHGFISPLHHFPLCSKFYMPYWSHYILISVRAYSHHVQRVQDDAGILPRICRSGNGKKGLLRIEGGFTGKRQGHGFCKFAVGYRPNQPNPDAKDGRLVEL